MYGQYDAVIVYGFVEDNREFMLDENWLRENYPDISIYASDIVRLSVGNAVYGIPVSLNNKTGVISVSEEEKAKVQALHDKYSACFPKKKRKREEDKDAKEKDEKEKGEKEEEEEEEWGEYRGLGFHQAVLYSDAEICHSRYRIDENNKRVITEEFVPKDRFSMQGMPAGLRAAMFGGFRF